MTSGAFVEESINVDSDDDDDDDGSQKALFREWARDPIPLSPQNFTRNLTKVSATMTQISSGRAPTHDQALVPSLFVPLKTKDN